jgi:hypothetical protein
LLLIDDNPEPPVPSLLSSTLSSSDALPPPLLVPVCGCPLPILLSLEQRRSGKEDPIHPPLFYFLLIAVFVFVAIKEIIVVDTSLPSDLSVRCPTIAVATALAIVAVAHRPLQQPIPPHVTLSAVG